MNYKVLVLPESGTMSSRLLKKISDMVNAGAVVIGKPPSKAVGLSGYPQSDEEVQKMVSQLWGNCDGISVKENSFGKGKIIYGKNPGEVLEDMGVKCDFQADKFIRFTDRMINNYDVYFVANPECHSSLNQGSQRRQELCSTASGLLFPHLSHLVQEENQRQHSQQSVFQSEQNWRCECFSRG